MLIKAWRGQERCWKVWWLMGLPYGLVAGFILRACVQAEVSTLMLLAVVMLYAAGLFLWMVCAWRCAPNVKTSVWTPTSRMLIVLQTVALVWQAADA
ncbi:conserved hypothetical protein [Paraburkholderia tropica]|uniref:hypothetical protein n=1 Tax=Paraburkholderia TaxID=1822464 RepID=UPI001CB6433A|nr:MULTISPECIES: hypothetical protein [Paraburkholderia]CAG9232798.1 conserved hypothetical protein [Paraburkholderia tropica]